MSNFIKKLIRKIPFHQTFRFSMVLFFLSFSVEGWAFYNRGAQTGMHGHHWTERSKQRQWAANAGQRNAWANSEWGRWRRNNYYYNYGWGSPIYSYGWYGYQLPYYTNYWPSYPSTFSNYTYPTYPYNGKWYTGSWPSYESTQRRNTGYYSGLPY